MRHRHTLSRYNLLTGDMGQLLPIGLTEVLAGDTIQHSASVFLRFSPMAAPVMHPIQVRVHHFFVPHRLTWPQIKSPPDPEKGWEAFITGGPTNQDTQVIPNTTTSGVAGDLFDYFGLPTVSGIPVSTLPIHAFNMIYNEFYRDQDLVPERQEAEIGIPKIAWEKDYLTMARPWTQKGDAITIPLGDTAPVIGFGKVDQSYPLVDNTGYETGGVAGPATYANSNITGDGSVPVQMLIEQDPNNPGYPNIRADLSKSGAVDINTFRRAFALQRYSEARARYGSRYTEYLRYLKVTPMDARLQRPEYLGGGTARVSTSEVLQTSDTQGAENERFGVGDMYGHGVATTRSNRYRRSFQEHGYIMSLLSVRPKSMYMDGISRTWLKRTNEDFWQKELEHIGQQEVWQGEVHSVAASGLTHSTFGYQDRYREYREENSRVCGEFRDVLKYWHLGREFATPPVLNQSFTDCDPSKRIYNVQTQHGLWIAVQHNMVARRLVGKAGISKIM